MSNFITTVKSGYHLVVVDILSTGFTVKADLKKDYGLDSADQALSTGGLKLIDNRDLNPFLSNRRHVTDTLGSWGMTIKSGSVYLIPDSRVQEVAEFLLKQQTRYFADRAALGADYRNKLQAWWDKNPNIKDRLRSLAPDWTEKESEFRFEVVITPLGESRIDGLSDGGLTAKLETAADTSISQICAIAREYNPTEGSRSSYARSRLQQMADRADSLALADPTQRLPLLKGYIEALIDNLPLEGVLEGYSHLAVSSAMAFMGDEKQITAWLNARKPVESVFDRLMNLTADPNQTSFIQEDNLLDDLATALDTFTEASPQGSIDSNVPSFDVDATTQNTNLDEFEQMLNQLS